jgi:hypothetical protein
MVILDVVGVSVPGPRGSSTRGKITASPIASDNVSVRDWVIGSSVETSQSSRKRTIWLWLLSTLCKPSSSSVNRDCTTRRAISLSELCNSFISS